MKYSIFFLLLIIGTSCTLSDKQHTTEKNKMQPLMQTDPVFPLATENQTGGTIQRP